jgi:hypothetical protein
MATNNVWNLIGMKYSLGAGNKPDCVRSEDLTAVAVMMMIMIWVVTPCKHQSNFSPEYKDNKFLRKLPYRPTSLHEATVQENNIASV